MSKLFRGEGKSVKISGQAADVVSGRIFRRSNNQNEAANPNFGGQWIGVVTDDVLGTTSTLTTLDGRPIIIGDGQAAEAQTGDGKGDMAIEGVFTLLVDATSAVISGAMPCYMQVASFANPQNTLIASGVTRNGAADVMFAVSGALVGFAVDNEYSGEAAPYAGRRVVDVKLLGNPLHDLVNVAP